MAKTNVPFWAGWAIAVGIGALLVGARVFNNPTAVAGTPLAGVLHMASPAPSRPVANGPLAIGTNVDGLAYWSSAVPLLDQMKSSGKWFVQGQGKWDTGQHVPVDERGWPTSIPAASDGSKQRIALIALRDAAGADAPHTRYIVEFKGQGELRGLQDTKVAPLRGDEAVVTSGDTGWIQLALDPTDPGKRGDYLRNIRIVREEFQPLYKSGATFNPLFLARIKPFGTIRFMDWMATNHLRNPDGTEVKWQNGIGLDISRVAELQWEERPRPEDARWNEGVPVEIMVELLNQTGADGWFNMPVNASDDYVRQFATYVRDHLDPQLRIHVEFSNEVWNRAFPQSHYAALRAGQDFGPGANWMEWYGKRTAEVGIIWNRVFHEPLTGAGNDGRVRIVYNTQLVYKGMETPGLETPHWRTLDGRKLRGADYVDEYAVAGYYEAGMSSDKRASQVMQWWNDADGGFGRAVATLRESIQKINAPLYSYHARRAAKYGLDLVTYEGGFGERTPISQHGNQRYTDFLIALQRRREMYELELANAAAFRRAGGMLLMNFGIVGKPSKSGSWSALESINQNTSPRYRALVELAEQGRNKRK